MQNLYAKNYLFPNQQNYQLSRLSNTIHIIMVMGVVFYMVFAYFDIQKTPELTQTILMLRIFSIIPLITISLVLLTNKYNGYMPIIILLLGLIPLLITMYMHTIIKNEIYFIPLTSSYFLLVIISLSALFSRLQLVLVITLGLFLSNVILFNFSESNHTFLIDLFFKSIGVYLFSIIITFKINENEKQSYFYAKELHFKSLNDPLTQVFNRSGFDLWVNTITESQLFLEKNVTLLMLDIDRFKKVNDTYGHQAGDDVLKIIASMIKSEVDSTSCIVRFGGEEFVIVTIGLNFNKNQILAERLREKIELKYFTSNKGIEFNVTASIGMAKKSKTTETIADLIKIADHNLYIAKQNGRNQIVY